MPGNGAKSVPVRVAFGRTRGTAARAQPPHPDSTPSATLSYYNIGVATFPNIARRHSSRIGWPSRKRSDANALGNRKPHPLRSRFAARRQDKRTVSFWGLEQLQSLLSDIVTAGVGECPNAGRRLSSGGALHSRLVGRPCAGLAIGARVGACVQYGSALVERAALRRWRGLAIAGRCVPSHRLAAGAARGRCSCALVLASEAKRAVSRNRDIQTTSSPRQAATSRGHVAGAIAPGCKWAAS